ncbi:MAG: 5-formyltetrahydrofolate cyclo-ligase [Granulosicoccaceae bacterium]
MNNTTQRDELRRAKQAQRLELSPEQLNTAANNLQALCTPFIGDKLRIAGYQAVRGEISVDALLQSARAKGAVTTLPIVNDETLLFAPFTDKTAMLKKRFGLLEPDVPVTTYLKPEELDCILMPLVAFDDAANRMGMGGGFYDKSFAFRHEGATQPLLIGVAHECQKSETVFHEWWDVPLDMVITDKNVYPHKP